MYEMIIRKRFLLVYKSDKLHVASDRDSDMTKRTNINFYRGDASADTELYENLMKQKIRYRDKKRWKIK